MLLLLFAEGYFINNSKQEPLLFLFLNYTLVVIDSMFRFKGSLTKEGENAERARRIFTFDLKDVTDALAC